MFALVLRRLPPAVRARALHVSAPVAKKAKAADLEDLDADSLFDDMDALSSSGERAANRAALVHNIVNDKVARVGELRKVVQWSDSPEELEELARVLRAWRVGGHRVTTQTAREIAGRCINLGRPDLAQKYVDDKLQFGLPPLPHKVAAKLQEKLA